MADEPILPVPSEPGLDAALDRLVSRGVLSPDQAAAVRAETAVQPSAAAAAPQRGVRGRLVEIAAYVGAVLVAASVVAFLADSWDELSDAARLALLAGSGLVAYAAGVAVALTVHGGFRVLREHAHAARRRVSGALMALGSVLLAFAAVQVLDGVERVEIVGAAVALALLVVAQLLAPSALTEVGMLGSTALLVGTTTEMLVPDRAPDWSAEVYQPSADELVVPLVLSVVGLLWGAVVGRWLTLPVLAAALGSVVALFSAFQLAVQPDKRLGLVLLAALAVVGLVLFLRAHLWPWLGLAVLALTIFVFVVVSEQAAPALAFLVAGLVLLGASLGAALLGRRRSQEPTAP